MSEMEKQVVQGNSWSQPWGLQLSTQTCAYVDTCVLRQNIHAHAHTKVHVHTEVEKGKHGKLKVRKNVSYS